MHEPKASALRNQDRYCVVPVRYRPNAASSGWSYGRDLAHAVKGIGYTHFLIINLMVLLAFAWLLYFDLNC